MSLLGKIEYHRQNLDLSEFDQVGLKVCILPLLECILKASYKTTVTRVNQVYHTVYQF